MTKEDRTKMSNLRRPCFVDTFSSNLSAERLKIPIKFVRHMKDRSGSVSLTGPSGNTWHVDLFQQNDGLFFDQGWPDFVRDHFVESGDLLVFRFDCELHFTVQVFDQSACEKEAAFNSKCSQYTSTSDNITGKKREREGVAAPSDKVFEGVLKKIREISSVLLLKDIGNDPEADSSEEMEHCDGPSKPLALPSQSKALRVKPVSAIQKRIREDSELNLHDKSCMSMSSEREEKKVAQSFTSCFPYFVRKMKRFNISGSYTLNVPYKFSTAHLPNCKTKIILHNLEGASWTVNSVPTTKVHTSHTFCGGWLAFVRNNEIKVGDICIFELVRECELYVHILRVGEEDLHGQSGKVDLGVSNVGFAVTAQKKFDGLAKKGKKNSLKVHSKCIKKVQICDKKGSKTNDIRKHVSATKNSASVTPCSQSKTSKKKRGAAMQNRNNVDAEMDSQAGSNLRIMLAHDEERAARSFDSSFPHFVRIMRKFNVSGSYTLKIPHQFSLAHLPDSKTEITLQNSQGECWTVNSVPDSRGRMAHTICGGWLAFVRGNDIKIGDICIFELISKCEMRVHISGVGRKGLDVQHGKSACYELVVASSTGDHTP